MTLHISSYFEYSSKCDCPITCVTRQDSCGLAYSIFGRSAGDPLEPEILSFYTVSSVLLAENKVLGAWRPYGNFGDMGCALARVWRGKDEEGGSGWKG